MSRVIRLATVQPPNERSGSTWQERKASNVQIALDMLEKAAQEKADITCLPECFPTRGLGNEPVDPFQVADAVGGEVFEQLAAFARQHSMYLVAPVTEKIAECLRNAAWVIDRQGNLVGTYHKVHCTEGERKGGVIPGDSWPVFDLDFGRIGIMICHDNSFPESARCLALNGAEIVFWPHVQCGWGGELWDITLRSRAIDNAVYLVSSCYGVRPGTAWRPGQMTGRSGIVGPDGMILAEAGRLPKVVITEIDLDHVLLKHDFTRIGDHPFWQDVLADRRPETYGVVTKTD
ncbi:MAG: carbon-nitrogen hydrolase family protein [Firmicutes bacterium]|nr:carbon-nitrogen hydrolase family protein [Bacillota bacterium]